MAFVETMKPRDRVLNALAGKPVDRPPYPIPPMWPPWELMDLVGAPFPEACRNPELNARLAATGYTELGLRQHHARLHDHPGILGPGL